MIWYCTFGAYFQSEKYFWWKHSYFWRKNSYFMRKFSYFWRQNTYFWKLGKIKILIFSRKIQIKLKMLLRKIQKKNNFAANNIFGAKIQILRKIYLAEKFIIFFVNKEKLTFSTKIEIIFLAWKFKYDIECFNFWFLFTERY